MKRWKSLAAIVASVAVLGGVAAGCSDSSSSEASTPAGATTAPNTAVQTDKNGSTVGPATETAPPTTTEAQTGGGGETASGDAAAGQALFTGGACQGCHTNGGQAAGVGPKLAGAGLTADVIKSTITNGKGVMPAGLFSGDDLENVTAYVLSIQ